MLKARPITWPGVAEQLVRARIGEVDYLAVCAATSIAVAKGGVDYQVKEGVSTLWQLAAHLALQSCGIGTFLVEAAENNPRARARPEAVGRSGFSAPVPPNRCMTRCMAQHAPA